MTNMDRNAARNIAWEANRQKALSAAAAAAVLGKRSSAFETLNIIRLLSHSDPKIRTGAIQSLTQIGGRDVIAPLCRCLNDPDHDVRYAACQALGQLRAHDARAVLVDALQDPIASVRCAAAVALSWMGDRSGLPMVAKLLKLSGRHQTEALRSLNLITGQRFPFTPSGIKDAQRWLLWHRKDLGL